MSDSEVPEGTVAIAYLSDGTIYDFPFTWETAQQMANEGYKIRAIADDGEYWTKERIQELCDGELQRAIDCFGEGRIK